MRQYLIIGNSAAGISAIEAIRALDKTSPITVVTDEDYPAYCRCLISYYLAGDVKEEAVLYRPQSFYKDNNVTLILNKKVTRVDPKKNRVICEDKTQLNYDSLLVATGARPRIPEIKGIKKKGIFGLRTIKDAKDISELLQLRPAVCVIGGGLVGLKAAYALKKRKVDVKVAIKSRQVLSQMLDSQAAGLVQRRLESNGIDMLMGQDVTEVIGEGEIKAVKLDSGKAFECSLIVVGRGVEPNTDLVKESEIRIDKGICVDERMQTSVPNIFSAGDVAQSFDLVLGEPSMNTLWTIAVQQGKAAGANMAGAGVSYDGSLAMNTTDFFGLPILSLGLHNVSDSSSGCEELRLMDEKRDIYKKVIIRGNHVVGAVLVGDIKSGGVMLRMIREKLDISEILDRLLREDFGYPDILNTVSDREKMYVG
jgi:NAD(P)H-nitrite reductase large subunit